MQWTAQRSGGSWPLAFSEAREIERVVDCNAKRPGHSLTGIAPFIEIRENRGSPLFR